MVWFLFRSNIIWPFVLQFSSSPFDFCLLPFWWVPSLVRSISMTLREIYFCGALLMVIFTVHLLQWGRSLWPWGTSFIFAVDHSLTSRLWACWKLLLQIVHWHVFVCASDFLLSPWNGFQHQKGLCETKHSPAWAMANMVPMWPQDSCFSPVVAGVGGLPFRWHDAGLPQWSLQIRNSELLNLWNSETGYFLSGTLSFSSLILEVIDYFWLLLTLPITCPNNRTW